MKAPIQVVVATNLKLFRIQAGLSQAALAEKAGMSLPYYNYLERKQSNLTIEVLQRLAEGLNVTMGQLLGESPQAEVGVRIIQLANTLSEIERLTEVGRALLGFQKPAPASPRQPLARGVKKKKTHKNRRV